MDSVPDVGVSIAPIMFRSVVLPHPLFPTIKISPFSGSSKVTFFNAAMLFPDFDLYSFVSAFSSNIFTSLFLQEQLPAPVIC